MTTDNLASVRVVRHFAGAPERLFDAWLDPLRIAKFLFATPTGRIVLTEIDARVGGKFLIADRRDGENVDHIGEYLVIDRPRHLAFSFAVPKYSAQFTRVDITIVAVEGGSELTLLHTGVLPEWAERTQEGWHNILEQLARTEADYGVVLAPDTIQFERILPGPIERVWDYLVRSELRGQWLASGALAPQVGGSFELHFHHASLSPVVAPTPPRYQKMAAGHINHHKLLRFDPPHALAFSWSEGTDRHSEVIFELWAEGEKVRLILTHRNLPTRALVIDVAGGWHTHLEILADRLNGREPAPFWLVHTKYDEYYKEVLA